MSYRHKEIKNLEENLRENDKKIALNLDRSKRERTELFEKMNGEEHMKNSCFKKLSERFSIDRKIGSID